MPLLRFVRPALAALSATAVVMPLAILSGPDDTRPPRSAEATGIHASGPIVFGHRGAAGYRPEHTLASYELAIAMGADYIEPDLVPTRDGVLVARHENDISGTTDVAEHPEFADRRTTKVVDGRSRTGWFTEDFTLAELKTLRAKERLPQVRQENTIYDRRYQIATLQEVIDLAKRAGREYGRPIGVFPETKHPTYFDSIGLSLEEPLIATIKRNGLNRPDGMVVVQSFETTSLRELDAALETPVLQAIAARGAPYDLRSRGDDTTFDDMITPAGLREIATYADFIGPDKVRIVPRNSDGTLGDPTTLIRDAHAAGLKISAYTFRNENRYLPVDLRTGEDPDAYGDSFAEYRLFYELGIDAVVSDNPDTAVAARRSWLADQQAPRTS